MKKVCIFTLALMVSGSIIHGQTINPSLLKNKWKAVWVMVPQQPPNDYGVFFFRKKITLQQQPQRFVVHVSADNRYKLYVNEKLVSVGPARGDVYYWNYETVDLAKLMTSGENVITAEVWNDGDLRPEAQISVRSGFILQGDGSEEEIVNTNNSWKCIRSNAYRPLTGIGFSTYYVAGPGEQVNFSDYPTQWKKVNFDDQSWQNAVPVSWAASGTPKGQIFGSDWMLVPSTIPAREMILQRFSKVRKKEGVVIAESFPAATSEIRIPANSNAMFLLDQSFLTNAYLTMNFSGGKDAGVRIRYAESMYKKLPTPGKWEVVKGNRNDVEDQFFAGRKDSLISNGKPDQIFTTLDWRTYRYVEVSVKTKGEPLVINDLYGTFTGYPFANNAKFDVSDKEINSILDIGWRTARLCAVETYMDCPYYERLQYIGDTRIQALVSYFNSGDDRLVRNALDQMDHSRIAEGITLSRHPSYTPQQIPTFSLWYIGMLHDYWQYRPDSSFVQEKLSGVRNVLDFFIQHQDENGSLKNVPYWLFTDWIEQNENWRDGVAPSGSDGSSAVLDLQLLWALQLAAEIEDKLGTDYFASIYKQKVDQLAKTIHSKYWDGARGLVADTGEKKLFSQHANALAILTGILSEQETAVAAQKLLTDAELTPASIYFKFYLHLALVKAGMGNDYVKWLDKWRENISMGLTTWAETSDISLTRSDCHAWGASPNIEFYRTVLGIDADSPGFKAVKVIPHLGSLTKVSGEIPHPNGKISAAYSLNKNIWTIDITLPQNTTGYLLWKDERIGLKSGNNHFQKK
jgi:alpha-L-rhamnosidase